MSDAKKVVNVTFLPEGKTVQANPGDLITDVAHANGIDIQMACGGNAACSTCRITINKDGFNAAEDMEQMWGLPDGERLSCQCVISGESNEIEIELLQ
jgi:2Fe-2S ferredoxin